MSVALLEYLQQQPGTTFKRLYEKPSTVLAILRRMLPHLAKNIVMTMLYMPEPFLESDLYTWIHTEARPQRDESMSVLERLHILTLVPEPPVPRAYRLNRSFALSLRQALTGGGSGHSFGAPSNTRPSKKLSVEDLDAWARGQWESILYYMVGSTGTAMASGGSRISSGTKALLRMGNFVTLRGENAAITKEGFTFLLQEANAQVWSLLIVYLDNSSSLAMDPVEMLSFLFMLGSLELGQDYGTEPLTPTQLQMLDDLNDFGIVYRPQNDSTRFFPTRLATTLTSSDTSSLLNDPKSSLSAQPGKGYIILETNHRLYAYTSSPLQIAVLNLFVRLTSRFPNLVSGKLTKDSVQRAITHGITSDQIVSYLHTHAHPQMQKSTPVLPPTVVDQIRLWQIEGDRMKATPGFLLKSFTTTQEYLDTARYAENLGVLVWRNDAKMAFFASRIEQLQVYLKNKAASAAASRNRGGAS